MILEFSVFKPFSDKIIHGVTTKPLGSFNNQEKNFEKQIKILPVFKPLFANQLHSDKIIVAKQSSKKQIEGDAFITQEKNLPIMVKVADCQGILMFDPKKNVIAAVHSGWRSSALNIIGKTIQKMVKKFKVIPSDLLVGISPSLGPCCAQFTDPKNELPDFIHPYIKGRNVDLWSLNMDQLKKAGVPKSHIEIMKKCTKCNPDKYFSHRNADNGRMAVFISLK